MQQKKLTNNKSGSSEALYRTSYLGLIAKPAGAAEGIPVLVRTAMSMFGTAHTVGLSIYDLQFMIWGAGNGIYWIRQREVQH